jgi:tRNA 2-thiocytidine biosynthesis protein TtcA
LQRSQIKEMLQTWEKQWPGRTETLFRSLQNVAPSQLADPNLFDFGGLESAQIVPTDDDSEEPIAADLEAEFNPAMALFADGLPLLTGAKGRDRQ